MALYRYVKAPPRQPRVVPIEKLVSSAMAFAGIALILWVVYPIISFELITQHKFDNTLSAVPSSQKSTSQEVVPLASASQDEYTPTEEAAVLGRTTTTDYTGTSNWLPSTPQSADATAGRTYFLSIPKLNIENAIVKIAGEDLDKSLIHYGGTGLPGEYGTSVVFGHSILPQFYNPNNYKAIFSMLPKLEDGDEIFLKYDGVTYRYVVYGMRVTTPEDYTVLEQRYDSSYLSLITCVPPGTYWKRLHVQARLEPV